MRSIAVSRPVASDQRPFGMELVRGSQAAEVSFLSVLTHRGIQSKAGGFGWPAGIGNRGL